MLLPPRGPTEAEAASLAALGMPAHPDPPANPRAELQAIFRICRSPWVADFLFSTEMTSLPALTAPLNIHNAVSSAVSLTNVDCAAFGDHPFDVQLSGAYVFVPSFSVGHVSLGFGVQQCMLRCYTDWCGKPGEPDTVNTDHFRYVRDDRNGVLIIFYRDPDTRVFKMDVISHIAAATRRRTFAVFDADRLAAAVRTEKGILHPDAVLPALNMINTVVESRDCSFCGAPRAGPCNCTIDLTPPSHPLDFRSLSKNMSAFLGAYQGLARATVYNSGVEVMNARVGSRITIDGGSDADLIARLSRWAITDQLKDKKESPFKSIMPPVAAAIEERQAVDLDVIDMAIDDGAMPLEYDSTMSNGPDSLLDPIGQGASSCSSGTGIIVADSLEDDNDVLPPSSQLPAEAPMFQFGATGTAAVESDAKVIELVNRITGGMGNGIDAMGVMGGDAEHSLESLSSEGCEGNAMVANGTTDNAYELGVARRERGMDTTSGAHMVSIAPAAAGSEPNAELDEKERRAQLRKQRNREAAQRSNMKRKQRNDTLKLALKETHAKAAELRVRELVLREENLRLRKQTSS